jgi:outer membrane protein TolC
MNRLWWTLLLAGCAGPRPWEAGWPRDPLRPPGAETGTFPVDLATVLRLAGANNLDIALVREKVHEAYGAERVAEGRFWPVLGPAAVFRRHEGLTQGTDGAFVDVDKQQTFAGGRAVLQWQVGEAIFAKLAASRRFEGALGALEAAEQSTALEAAVAYYDLLRDTLRARVAEQAVGISEKLVGQLETSVSVGRSFKGDLLRSRVQRTSNRLAAARFGESSRLASIRLAAMLRLEPEIDLIPAEDRPLGLELVPADLPLDRALQEAMDQRPELREARAELEAARREHTAAVWGPAVPDLMVDVAPGSLGPTPGKLRDTLDFSILLGWRIGPGGLFDPGRREVSEARARRAEIQVARVSQKISEQVRSAWTQLRSRREQMKLAEEAIRDAEEALDLNLKRQSTGVGLPLEVIQAEEALTRARLDHVAGVMDYNQAQLRLFAYRGARIQVR